MQENILPFKLEETGFGYTMSLISGKYKLIILFYILKAEVVRYNQLKRLIGGISHKTLSASLKELETDGLIERKEYPQVPPKVEYRLSARGRSLIPVFRELCEWGKNNRP